jgi:hypothetical protein
VTVIPPALALEVIGPTLWSLGFAAHIHTGIPTRPMLFGPGFGAIPISMAVSPICFTAFWATSRGVGPAPESGGALCAQIVMSIPVCGWLQL